MSLAELKSELRKLSPLELKELGESVQALLKSDQAPAQSAKPVDSFGCGRGLMVLTPGWDADEPTEVWEALQDDASA